MHDEAGTSVAVPAKELVVEVERVARAFIALQILDGLAGAAEAGTVMRTAHPMTSRRKGLKVFTSMVVSEC